MNTQKAQQKARLESSYLPARNQYRIDGSVPEIKLPRQRYYHSHQEMLAAVQRLNANYVVD